MLTQKQGISKNTAKEFCLILTKVRDNFSTKGPSLFFILHKDIGVGGPENGNFPSLCVVKMFLRRWVGGSKKPQNTLT